MPVDLLSLSMQTAVMIKGLPRTFNHDDFQRVLAETELYIHACKYNIPGSVIRRQDDPNAPPAYAFVEFQTPEMAHYAWKVLWGHAVWDRVDFCWRPISTAFATPKMSVEPPPEDSPEPTSNTKTRKWVPVLKSEGKEANTVQPQISEAPQAGQPSPSKKK